MGDVAIDRSPGETRAVVYEGGEAAELHILRDGALQAGDIAEARIIEHSAVGWFAESSAGETLLIRDKAQMALGTRVNVEIIRAAISQPGQIKCALGQISDDLPRQRDPIAKLLGRGRQIDPPADFDAAFDDAEAGFASFGVATLWFERTKAGLIIDVDGPESSANLEAAVAVARILRLYQIGGAVMVDFISTESKAARNAIAEAFDVASASDPRAYERTSVNGFGLLQIIRPQTGPSLLDQLYGTNRTQLSLETQALRLIRQASRASGFGPRQITASPALAARLALPAFADHIAAAARLAGAPVEIVADPVVAGYGQVHVRQS